MLDFIYLAINGLHCRSSLLPHENARRDWRLKAGASLWQIIACSATCSWGRLILGYSQSTSWSSQPGERPATARSGDVSSTRQHSITAGARRHWRRCGRGLWCLDRRRLSSGGLPIRQNRQLPKARHGAGARPVQRKARKMFYQNMFFILLSFPSFYVSFLCSMFMSLQSSINWLIWFNI